MQKVITAERLKQLMRERDLKQIDIVNLSQPFCKQYDIKTGSNFRSIHRFGDMGLDEFHIWCDQHDCWSMRIVIL